MNEKQKKYIEFADKHDYDGLKKIIIENKELLKVDDKNGFYPMGELTKSKSMPIEIIKLSLDFGADPNEIIGKNKFSPLYNVSWFCDLEKAKLLLEYGANINTLNNWNMTAIGNCVLSPFFEKEYFLFLLENGCNYKFVDTDGENIIDYAKKNTVISQNIEIFKDLYNNDYTSEYIKSNLINKITIDEKGKIKIMYDYISFCIDDLHFISNLVNKILNQGNVRRILNYKLININNPDVGYLDVETKKEYISIDDLKDKVQPYFEYMYFPEQKYDENNYIIKMGNAIYTMNEKKNDAEALSLIYNDIIKELSVVPFDTFLLIYYILLKNDLLNEAIHILNLINDIHMIMKKKYGNIISNDCFNKIDRILSDNINERTLDIIRIIASY